jgi:hypothetical protein
MAMLSLSYCTVGHNDRSHERGSETRLRKQAPTDIQIDTHDT